MEIDRAGVEYAVWGVTSEAPLTGTPQVRIDDTWHDALWAGEQVQVGTSYSRSLRLLVAGPDAPVTVGAVVLPRGRHRTSIRVTGLGEQPVRDTEDILID